MVNLGKKIRNAKSHFTVTLESFCEKKNPRKNTKYSKNETILKTGDLAKAIVFTRREGASLLYSPIRPRSTHHYQCDVT